MNPIIVVGGGPAGLMAADVVSAAGHPVIVFERMPTLGRKFLMAGRGGLNLTTAEPIDKLLTRYGAAAEFLGQAVAAFPPEALIAFAADLGQETFIGSSGRVFPKAMKASPLLRAWLARLAHRNVDIRLRHTWIGLDGDGRALFQGPDGAPIAVAASAIVLALGGGSWPRLGSDGKWVEILSEMGVSTAPLTSANAGLEIAWSDHFRTGFAGHPLKRIAVGAGGAMIRGEAVVTTRGLEGGALYALNPDLRKALAAGSAKLTIDLRPDLDLATLAERLRRRKDKLSVSSWLRRTVQLSPAGIALLREVAGPALPEDRFDLARLIKGVAVPVTGLGHLDRAISSAGGIALPEVDSNLMLASHPGVFVAGEMLDWEAPTGGYLLQGCFSTGHAAGRGVLRHLGSAAT